MIPSLTKRQRDVLFFCADFLARNDQLPPLDYVCSHFGWRSWNSAMEHVQRLVDKGYLERNEVGKYRLTSRARAFIASPSEAPETFRRTVALAG